MVAARRFTRRTLLKGTAAAGTLAAMGPWIVRDARSASGELNILVWSDEVPDPLIPNFTKATGIKVNTTPFSQNEEQINKLQATGGEGFDLCQPTRDRQPQFHELIGNELQIHTRDHVFDEALDFVSGVVTTLRNQNG